MIAMVTTAEGDGEELKGMKGESGDSNRRRTWEKEETRDNARNPWVSLTSKSKTFLGVFPKTELKTFSNKIQSYIIFLFR